MSSEYDWPGPYRNPTYPNYPHPATGLGTPMFPGGQTGFPTIPNFPTNPKDVIIFIGPPQDPENGRGDTYRYKQEILENLKVRPENIYYFDSIKSLVQASKVAIDRSGGNNNQPSLYFWGHGADGSFMFNAGNRTDDPKDNGMEAIKNTIDGLKPSQVTILACNFAGKPNSFNTKGEGVINELSKQTKTTISSIKGFEAPFLSQSQYLWYLQNGGSIYTSVPGR
ncbi:MAG: hypothetical protein WCJ40_21170 [Planctomycetota bacterium]